jgi:2-polyprenyl-3-methyl-5-hydroxy-6-metoxy-1,4-benzoquinol methylase
MKKWERYWNEFPNTFPEQYFLEQVGKTVNKKPISDETYKEILKSILCNLKIYYNDDVLDLCCGNGLITKSISYYCKSISGIDFSKKLIEIAKSHNSEKNIEYICGDVNEICNFLKDRTFSKIFLYEALQHFDTEQFEKLLVNLRCLMKKRWVLFIGSVPDKNKKWKFYNTVGRKLSYIWRVINNDEAIGTWWDKNLIRQICDKSNLHVQFLKQNYKLHTAHYRFDLCIYD